MNQTNQIVRTVQGYLINTRGPWQVTKSQIGIALLTGWRDAHQDSPDYWLRIIICEAFRRMITRRLSDAPPAELMAEAASDWCDIIGEHLDETDSERVVIAFKAIFRECRRWPQPADLIKRLPTRIKKPAGSTVMEAPQTDEQHARGTAAFDEIMGMFR